MWLWVIVALAALVIVILLVLCIPLDLIVHVNTSESPAYKVRLLWLFGLIDQDLRKTTGKKPAKKEKVAEVRTKKKPGRGISPSTIYRILRTTGLFSQVKRLLTGIVNSLKIKHLAANLKLGLENPADTALLFAVTGPVNFLLSLLPYRITIWPTFDSDLALEAYVHGAARLWTILLVFALLKFIFSWPALQITRILVTTRWKKA